MLSGGRSHSPNEEEDGKYDSRKELDRVTNVLKEYTFNIDNNLKEVVQKHERQYLEAYNIYVKRKEAELH